MKVELFQELEGQSYPVLKFEVEIYTFAIVGGCKLYFTLDIMLETYFEFEFCNVSSVEAA